MLDKIKKSGQLSPELQRCIKLAQTLEEIESLSAPFKSSAKQTLANKAREMGLEQLAKIYLTNDNVLPELPQNRPENDAQEQIGYIISDILIHTVDISKFINEVLVHDGRIFIESNQNTSTIKKSSSQKSQFDNYFDFKNSIGRLKSHQILAINRGEKKKELKVKIVVPDILAKDLERKCLEINPLQSYQKRTFVSKSIQESFKRLIKPMIQRRVRTNLTKKADLEALDVFAENLRNLLLTSPCSNTSILSIDPGFKHGCKLAIIDGKGIVQETGVIFPKFKLGVSSLTDKEDKYLIKIINDFNVEIIGIGNGTGSKQIENIVAEMIRKKVFRNIVAFTIVNEDGASIYR